MPQCTAQTTRSTLNLPSLSTVTSATCATTVPNDSCTATPRPRFSPALPAASGLSQPALSAARLSAARWRACLASSGRRKATGSLPAASREFVDERLGGERRVRRADGAPPQHRHAELRRMQVDAEVGDVVGQRRRAFDAGQVDAVLHHHRLERGAGEDRLADDPVLPAGDVAVRIESGAQRVQVHRAVVAALHVVLARPHHLHRDARLAAAHQRDGDRHGLEHVVGRGAGAAAETAAGEQHVEPDLLGLQARVLARWRTGRRSGTARRSRSRKRPASASRRS